LAASTADKATTFLVLFFAQMASWAGVPALGAATAGAAGALANQGTLHLWAVIVVGTAGAEIGSLAGWWFGNRAARTGLDAEGGSKRRRAALDAGEKIERKWGRLIVFFVPSWVSGALGMQFRQFATWNLLAALVWNVGAMMAAYGVASAVSGGSLWEILIPIAIAFAAGWVTTRIFRSYRRHHPRRAKRSAPAGGQPPSGAS
jgi:membrane protein DedA with SNARE-associated domain